MSYEKKYLKYKNKYTTLKNQMQGGAVAESEKIYTREELKPILTSCKFTWEYYDKFVKNNSLLPDLKEIVPIKMIIDENLTYKIILKLGQFITYELPYMINEFNGISSSNPNVSQLLQYPLINLLHIDNLLKNKTFIIQPTTIDATSFTIKEDVQPSQDTISVIKKEKKTHVANDTSTRESLINRFGKLITGKQVTEKKDTEKKDTEN